jgi:hypothetical protein
MRQSHFSVVAIIALSWMIGGCASADVEPEQAASRTLPRPDMIIVHDFAVTPDEIQLDQGVMATVYRDSQARSPNADQARAGHAVADQLAQKLVDQLNRNGIPAARARSGARPTSITAVIKGQFVTIDQGNQSERVWIGFGMGGSELCTRGQAFQNGQMISQFETRTKASMTPGMVVGLATGAAAGSVGTSAVTGAAGAGFSETFLASVEADAARTADAMARKIFNYYVERGWLK